MVTQSEIATMIKKNPTTRPENLRAYLLKQGCTKGTASKAVTVLVFLQNGVIEPDFKSLGEAYDVTRFIKKGWTPSPTV